MDSTPSSTAKELLTEIIVDLYQFTSTVLYEINDDFLRSSVERQVSAYLDQFEIITKHQVICDETNNITYDNSLHATIELIIGDEEMFILGYDVTPNGCDVSVKFVPMSILRLPEAHQALLISGQ